MYPDFETLKVERDGPILTLLFNRPERRNATNPKMHQELIEAFRLIAKDDSVGLMILSGAGGYFSAGGDIASMNDSMNDNGRWIAAMAEARELLYSLMDIPHPVIARINGHAMGLSATLALFCDVTVMQEDSRIADTHVKVGLVAGDGGSIMWPVLLGYARAKELLLTGDPLTGAEAAKLGLITHAVPKDELEAKVADIAQRILANPRIAVRGTKQAINMALRSTLDALVDGHLGLETISYMSSDYREAVAAFVGKRAPVFTGK
jgi:enoyl-CoA hydratase